MAIVPSWALAQEGSLRPDGLPRATPGRSWKIPYSARFSDVLAYPQSEVVAAARHQLETDQWQIYSVDSARGVISTKWNALKHPLVSAFMGKLWMRCIVHVRKLGPNRSQIIFRADLASHDDLTKNPMFGDARRAYETAARKYLIKVRQYLYDHGRKARPARARS